MVILNQNFLWGALERLTAMPNGDDLDSVRYFFEISVHATATIKVPPGIDACDILNSKSNHVRSMRSTSILGGDSLHSHGTIAAIIFFS